jgi:hypothetical protein
MSKAQASVGIGYLLLAGIRHRGVTAALCTNVVDEAQASAFKWQHTFAWPR